MSAEEPVSEADRLREALITLAEERDAALAAAAGRRGRRRRGPARVGPGQVALTARVGPTGAGEVWVLDAHAAGGARADLREAAPARGWHRIPVGGASSGFGLVGRAGGGECVLPVGTDGRLTVLRHPWSGVLCVRSPSGTLEVDLYADDHEITELRLDGVPEPGVLEGLRGVAIAADGTRTELGLDAWLAHVRAIGGLAGIVDPGWRGVTTSLENLLDAVLPAAPPAAPAEAERLAEALASGGVRVLVTGGLAQAHETFLRAVAACGVRVLVTWHGTLLQHGAQADRAGLSLALRLVRDGVAERIGFVKPGLAGLFAGRGIATATIENTLRGPALTRAPRAAGPARVGIWSVAPIWRKLPYAMLAACAELDREVVVHASGDDAAMADLAAELGIDLRLTGGPVPADAMPARLGAMDLNLYVTLSECGPMVLLESLSAGVPCLAGASTAFFDHDPYLRERLVVEPADRQDLIAAAARRALDEADAITAHYREVFAPAQRARAEAAFAAFVAP